MLAIWCDKLSLSNLEVGCRPIGIVGVNGKGHYADMRLFGSDRF
jgi:hypothetical protein